LIGANRKSYPSKEGEEEMVLAGLSLGARDFLLKPIHSEYVVYKCHIHF
jgi:DNA-binding response OmpR family regulator